MTKKYKLLKIKNKIIASGLAAVLSTTTLVSLLNKQDKDDIVDTPSYTDSNQYLEIDYNNKINNIASEKANTKIKLNYDDYLKFVNELKKYNYNFGMSDYYDINNTLKVYNNTKIKKNISKDLFTGNLLDSEKLYNVILKNNKDYMSGSVNSINTFFSEAPNEYIRNICNLIARTYNANEDIYEPGKVGDTLMHLKIFKNETSSSNAYVNDDLILVYNPNMINLFTDMQTMRNNIEENISVEETILIHEIEHILQNSSNDFVEENGQEVGFCRKYNNVNVNSLWYTWLLESSAEVKMAEILGVTTKNYDKKISYARSYNLSRIFENDFNVDALVDSTFTFELEETYLMLNLNTEEEQKKFLELMYSIELTQYESEDFWKYYEDCKKITLTENQKLYLKKNIRQEVVKNLSRTYYEGLVKAIVDGKIKDLETIFYLVQLWELDCYNHLQYTSEDSYENAEDFLLWQDEVHNILFDIIAISNNLDSNSIKEDYYNYCYRVNIDGKEVINCDLNGFDLEKQNYLSDIYSNYSVNKFAKNSDVVKYINEKVIVK